jgi:hypothetical protein
MRVSNMLIAASAAAALAACGSKPGMPSAPSAPAVPGADKVPAGGMPGGPAGEVDPNGCGGYAASEAGARLKAFLTATKDLQTASAEMANSIKSSCVAMGGELGMAEGDLSGDTGAVCNKVFDTYKANLKVAFKASAKLKVKYEPAVCKIDASASASGGAACSGAAAADNSGGGAAAQCKASGSVEASVHATCTEAKLTIDADAKLIVDKSKAEMTLKAARDGFPKIFMAAAKAKVLEEASVTWAKTAVDLKDVAPKLAQSFKDQMMCVTGQLGAVAAAVPSIQANVSVSVSVSASASGSVGG